MNSVITYITNIAFCGFEQINWSLLRCLHIEIHNIFMTAWIKQYLYQISMTILIIKMILKSVAEVLPQEYKPVQQIPHYPGRYFQS